MGILAFFGFGGGTPDPDHDGITHVGPGKYVTTVDGKTSVPGSHMTARAWLAFDGKHMPVAKDTPKP